MPTPDTITRGAGQAQRSAARLILTVAKYTGLTLSAAFRDFTTDTKNDYLPDYKEDNRP